MICWAEKLSQIPISTQLLGTILHSSSEQDAKDLQVAVEGSRLEATGSGIFCKTWGSWRLPSGKHTKSYWKPFIIDFPMNNGDFP